MIEDGKRVTFHYILKVDGKVVEKTRKTKPLEYVHGKGQILPGLQKSLEGHNEGDECQVTLEPKDAYGFVQAELLVQIDRAKIPTGEELKLGALITAKSESGKTITGSIRDISPEIVLVDFNHPLAGKTLHFDIKIVQVKTQ
ncbi:MAG: peptidylprolyl isomerase [Candidatus Omnitrophica bacterium]|nr:peptidylprolyl isomerase [Candidatus Omnitrophota bacterium]